ncbi:MAG: murein hydrolase activator EnvC family protein [Dysgonomonas sp.]
MIRFRLLVILLFISIFAFSQSNKIKDLENKRKQTLREIENNNKLLNETKRTTSTLLNRIKIITTQISARQQVLTLLGEEVDQLTIEESETEKEIAALEAELKEKQKSYAKAIDGLLQKRQKSSRLLYILSGRSLSESFRRFMYLKDYSEWRSKQADDIKKQRDALNQKRAALEQSRKDKLALLGLRESEQNKLQQEEQLHQDEVSEANKKQKELQDIIREKQKQANALNAQIESLIAAEVARQEKEAKRLAEEERKKQLAIAAAAAKKEKKAEAPKTSQAKPSTSKAETTAPATPANETRESFALSSNFASNKGKLPMPITGSSLIIGKFGAHQHNSYITTNSNGIDIQSQSGAEARSVFDGEVTTIAAIPGYNVCIIVRHGSYYTFYGNIQNVYVKQGQRVNTGQSLGKVYFDSNTGSSQMHFQLWKGTTKLNPEPWIRR